jgi:hypothetical protein
MSSIKRDVKKKSSALTGGRDFFLEIQAAWLPIHSARLRPRPTSIL